MLTRASYPGQRLLAAGAVLGPVVFLLADVSYITAGDGINNGVLGGTIGVWSCILLGWAFLGIARALETAAPRGALTLLVLAVPMVAGGAAFNVNAIHREHFGNDFMGVSDSSAGIGVLAFLPWGWFAPASFVVAGIFVWRTKIAPRWTGILTVLTGLLFISARPAQLDVLVMVCDVTMVLGVVPIGLTLLRRAAESRRLDATDVPVRA